MVIRNWRDELPTVGHNGKLIWSIFRARGTKDLDRERAPLAGMLSLTLHRMQGGGVGDYHVHQDKEQVYYFLQGRGRMRIDGDFHAVREGDAVHIPPGTRHQLLNDEDDWIEHLIVSAEVRREKDGEENAT